MALQIDNADRIANRYPPLDPNDKTELNADNIMLMLDKIVNGQYRIKVKTLTYQEILNLANKEAGEIFFATDTKHFYGWTGSMLVDFGGE